MCCVFLKFLCCTVLTFVVMISVLLLIQVALSVVKRDICHAIVLVLVQGHKVEVGTLCCCSVM